VKEGGFAPFDWRRDGGDGGRISTGNDGSAGSGAERPVASVPGVGDAGDRAFGT
jgi:hypothetical protein